MTGPWPWLSRPVLMDQTRIASGRALLAARQLSPGLYLVVGEAGAGKRSLLSYLARGLALSQLKHRACPAPWRLEAGPVPEELRARWVLLAEDGEPEAYRELALRHPVLLAVPPEVAELTNEREVAGFWHLPPFEREEARRFLRSLARWLKRRAPTLPPRQRPSWIEAFTQEEPALLAWAEAVARSLTSPLFLGLAQPLFFRYWAMAAPPGRPGFARPRALIEGVLEALATHAGRPLDIEAAKALAVLRPRPAVGEAELKRQGLLARIEDLAEIGVVRRYRPDAWGFAHPAFAGYFLALAEAPRPEDDRFAWTFYLEAVSPEEAEAALRTLMVRDPRKALTLAGRLRPMLDRLLERLCAEAARTPVRDRVQIALDPTMPYEVLERLAQDPLLRWAVAANPGAPPDLLRWIYEQAQSAPPLVREGLVRAILRNPNAPEELSRL